MGWRSDHQVPRTWALEEVISRVVAMSDQELSDLVNYLNPDRTVNYRVKEREDGE